MCDEKNYHLSARDVEIILRWAHENRIKYILDFKNNFENRTDAQQVELIFLISECNKFIEDKFNDG